MIERVEFLMKEMIDKIGYEKSSLLLAKLPKGKRLRTKLILKIATPNEKSLKLAAIVELIHAASLLHDDVIDDAATRRGVDSINAIYGNKNAIMLGDIFYSKAFGELVGFGGEIAGVISNAVTLLSVGEMMDVELSNSINLDENLYMDMIYKKTASLIEASAHCAAILEGKDCGNYALYGKNLGLAFQIIDDILDITQTSQKLGKPSLSDFKEGKTTLPYIYLYNFFGKEVEEGQKIGDINRKEENIKNREKLLSLFKKELMQDEQDWLKNMFEKSGSIEKSLKLARKLGNLAIEAIQKDKNDALVLVVKEMIEREF